MSRRNVAGNFCVKAVSIYKELLTGGVIERTDTPDEHGSYLRLTEDLQDNFALNQPLSAFAVAAIELFGS